MPGECVRAGVAVEQAGAEQRMALWNEPGLPFHWCRNKEPGGVSWPGKVHWASLLCVALMPASLSGLPQNKRRGLFRIFLCENAHFYLLAFHIFPPLQD